MAGVCLKETHDIFKPCQESQEKKERKRKEIPLNYLSSYIMVAAAERLRHPFPVLHPL